MTRHLALLLPVVVCLFASCQGSSTPEEKAVQAIETLGARVYRDDKLPGRPVVDVKLIGTKVTDAGLKDLKELKNLKFLCLAGTKISSAGLKDLQQALPKTNIYPP